MYLKGIEVNGFKSFADKINLEFGQGITAIVGPNGSGKSNVSDAIRWVLGEQSAKSLRGGKMEDVIFAGTQKRSPMGFAQVSIVFDNKSKIFNSEFDEIKVTRKLHRSGESEFLINNTNCRLRDIHELFMDTGLGREGYSVIGQGKIDQILSSKAEERRHIFEEASGITKYKYRKNDAEKKLVAAEDNLLRIKDIIETLSEQVGPLENQSKKARKYLDLRELLKGLDINISIRKIDKHRESLKQGQEKFNIAFNHLNDEKNKLHTLEQSIEQKTNQLTELNRELTQIREQAFSIEKGSGSLQGKIEILLNDSKNNSENALRWEGEVSLLREKTGAIEAEKEQILKDIENINAKKQEAQKVVEFSRQQLDDINKKIDDIYNESEEYKNQIVDLLGEISAIKARSSSMDVLLKNFDERKETLQADLATKKQAYEHAQTNLKKLNSDLEQNNQKSNKATDDMEKLKGEYFDVVKKLDKAKEQQNEFVSLLNEKQSRKNILEDLEKGYEGYSKGVKHLLSKNFNGICGVVSKLVEVEDKYVTAAEIALGSMLQNIVVKDESTAKKCIEELKQSKTGRATFLPITSVKGEAMQKPPSSQKGYIGLAYELIAYDKKYDGIFKSLLGRCVVADNIDNAVNMAKNNDYKFKIVTLDGQVVNAGGSFTGGSIGKNQSLLSRAKDIEKLAKEIAQMQKKADDADDQVALYKQQINKMADKKAELEQILKACEHEEVRLNSQIASEKRISDDALASITMLTNESGEIINEIADIDKQKHSFKEQITEREEKIRIVREMLNKTELDGADLAENRDKIVEADTQNKIVISSFEKDIAVASEKLKQCDIDIKSNVEQTEQKLKDISFVAQQNKNIDKEIECVKQQIDNAKQNSGHLYQKIDAMQNDYDTKSQKLLAAQNELKSQNDIIYDLQQEVVRLEAKNEKLESDTEAIINKLWEDYELTYNTALEFKKTDFNMNEAVSEASTLRNQIKALGHINLDAIEQYKEVKERFDYLTEQKKDLDETKAKLEGIIREMQTIMIKQFNQTFDVIKNKFGETFSALFGGGVGILTLSEPDNVLESGIEIEVQPPGKKLQNMMALSGGERALSAIALLFSVLEVRPTPFCILDEVEAALDDNNVYRFADYIKKYSADTQFIVVTHRRGTMEAADIMYGVTMQEKGISKLLKLKFEDLKEYSTDGV